MVCVMAANCTNPTLQREGTGISNDQKKVVEIKQ